MKNKMLISFVIGLFVIGGGAFYGGLVYGKSQASSAQNLSAAPRQQRFGQGIGLGQNGQFNRQAGPGALGRNGNFVNGEIIAKDNLSITVKDPGGGSKIIFLSGSTQVSKFIAGQPSDLSVGQSVMVSGTANSDGSLTAQMIQLRPPRPENASSTLPVRF
ncbi:hypothetical protein A3H09_04045 [Candidatus Falkowbacteria bacterium RIFCSPLOWO2_12_FULL_45_13]|uniref:DUF5666 domain-containing protein n=2 Tax=Candidatus Falkowiibacteriota TaxID=1752728 RepID=A0A1F5SBD6_9BACT|nr:MAG: hypothetical protein A3H66_02635 [Candidatus Falkowbacteria bacterium RIFCSPLOWO2_02_FULL_45_21]OGF30511.1 MAG: hypothetical protein A3H09_04045 [Candidatus Falkowbacteria bacterium RIFCSPLOWO2_12_FULL_45_13]